MGLLCCNSVITYCVPYREVIADYW